jgi:hypothetical protein
MKYILKAITITCCLFFLFSCGDNKAKDKNNIQETGKTVKKTSKTTASLVSETPLSKEQFESWLPETLLGLPRTSENINGLKDMGSCTANYSENNTRIRLMVFDAAGQQGYNVTATYRDSSTRDYDEKGSWGYTKTKIINGIKVKESYLKDEKYNLSIYYNNRFAVDIETHEIGEEKLEQLLKELNLDQLQ